MIKNKGKKPPVLSKTSVVLSDTDVSSQYTLHRLKYSLGQELPAIIHVNRYDQPKSPSWDIHTGLEMGVILRGRVVRWHSQFRQTLTPGEIWLCNAWEPHGFCVEKTPADILLGLFWPVNLAMSGSADHIDYLHLFRLPASDRPQTQTKAAKQKIIRLAREAAATLDAPYALQRKMLLMKQILLELMTDNAELHTGEDQTTGLNRILPALQLVQDHPTRRISLDEAARECHISTPLLTRLFRTMTGVSFADYARRRRLAALASELRSGEQKIASLAKKYGFIDAPHLNRIFKAAFGMTPHEYRMQTG